MKKLLFILTVAAGLFSLAAGAYGYSLNMKAIKAVKPVAPVKVSGQVDISAYAGKAYNALAGFEFMNQKLPAGLTLPTFSITGAGFKKIVFNVVNPEYIRAINGESAGLGQFWFIYQQCGGANLILGNMGWVTSGSGCYPALMRSGGGNIYGPIESLGSIKTIVQNVKSVEQQFDETYANKQTAEMAVFNYYGGIMDANLGKGGSSYLKDIAGTGFKQEISYPTILSNANMFLKRILFTQENISRFEILFGKKFSHSRISMDGSNHSSKYFNEFTMSGPSMAAIANAQETKGTYSAAANVLSVERNSLGEFYHPNTLKWIDTMYVGFPLITLKNINFFSVTYLLVKNIQGRHNRHMSEKILHYIITGQTRKAAKIFLAIKAHAQGNGLIKRTKAFITAYRVKNINAMRHIAKKDVQSFNNYVANAGISNHRSTACYKALHNVFDSGKFGEPNKYLPRESYLMQILLLTTQNDTTGTNGGLPWAGAVAKANTANAYKTAGKIRHLWRKYKNYTLPQSCGYVNLYFLDINL
jgi:hypothetical protein